MMSSKENTSEPRQSGKGMANAKPCRFVGETSTASGRAKYAKTDSRYWLRKIFKPIVVGDGKRRQVDHYSARMQWQGRRQSFPLLSGNAEAAATRAAKIFKSIQVKGWEATLAEFSPTHGKAVPESILTVGKYLLEVAKVADIRPRTLADYMRSFRRIVADLEEIDDSQGAKGKAGSRFNYREGGGREEWAARVHAVPLTKIRKDRIQAWKLAFVARAHGDPIKEKSAKISANSYIRQARSLFSKRKVLAHLPADLKLPGPLPFDGVDPFPRQSMRYSSKMSVAEVLQTAAKKLASDHPEQWKIMLLAICAGLRPNEIDSLQWVQVDFDRGIIRIEVTEFHTLKSEESGGDVEIDAELVAMLRGFHARKTGPFVIESPNVPKPAASYPRYRAGKEFSALCGWLRSNGVDSKRPIHTLRKEFGSLINQKAGIYAASRALRHADIKVTASHSLDRKDRVTLDLAALLRPPKVSGDKPAKSASKIISIAIPDQKFPASNRQSKALP